MADLFIHGHGGWKPADGYTKVPRGTSVVFYTHFAKLLNATMAYPILSGAYGGEPEREIAEFNMAPNMVLSSLTPTQFANAEGLFAAGAGRGLFMLPVGSPRVHLSDILDAFRSIAPHGDHLRLHWIACQSLGLKKVGGRALGLNASDRSNQAGHAGQYLLKWKDSNGAAQQRWVDSNSSHNKAPG